MEGSDDFDRTSSVSRGIRLKKKIKIFWEKHYKFGPNERDLQRLRKDEVYNLFKSMNPEFEDEFQDFQLRSGRLGVQSIRKKKNLYFFAAPITDIASNHHSAKKVKDLKEVSFHLVNMQGLITQECNKVEVLDKYLKLSDGETPPFSIKAGILQGDTLAPFLFIIVVDYVLRMSVDTIKSLGYEIEPRRSTKHPAQHLTDTDFADDIALISESLINAQSLLQSF